MWLVNLYRKYKKRLESRLCTNCGKPFSRLEWGGRIHYSRSGGSSIHPIDYIVTLNSKTFTEKRQRIAELEEMERETRKHSKKYGKVCENHYLGCPK